jgi:hypothetical protein
MVGAAWGGYDGITRGSPKCDDAFVSLRTAAFSSKLYN